MGVELYSDDELIEALNSSGASLGDTASEILDFKISDVVQLIWWPKTSNLDCKSSIEQDQSLIFILMNLQVR